MKTNFYLANTIKLFLFTFLILFSAAISAQTFRIFNPGTEGPSGGAGGGEANLDLPGINGIVTGLKFRVTQGGTIGAIHFYKGTTNVAANVVTLWNLSGTSLGTATLPADGVSGWRTVALGTPVTVSAGITYIVSVYNSAGIFAGSSGGIPNSDVTSRPGFIVIGGTSSAADPANPGNGVYDETNSSAVRPTTVEPSLYNFWLDVQFTSFFPLPARLTDFNASVDNSRSIKLTWKTESEQNNSGFDIERSNNGADWYPVNFVKGAGESATTKNYSYIDKSMAPGVYYYRLNQKDYDGHSSKSSIISVTISGKGNVSLTVLGNPFITSTNIRFDLPVKQKIRLSVFDINGREVKVLADNTRDQGTHQVTLNADGLSRQSYFVRLQTETETVVKQVVIQ